MMYVSGIRNLLPALLLSGMMIAVTALTVNAANICYDCHNQAMFKNKVIHDPVVRQQCDQCHNPHLARYDGLLHQQGEKLCARCHQSLEQQLEQQEFTHLPAKQGKCNICHDPHASQQPQLLRDKMKALCFSCHDDLSISNNVRHAPFAQGNCLVCHKAHSSDKPMLLRKNGTALCLSCHDNNSALRSKHLNHDLSQIVCLECHQPHQSENKGLLRNNQHQPFTQGKCQVCHSQEQNSDLCLGCHENVMDSFNQPFNHITPGAGGSFCFNCHTPHASQQAGLVRGYPGEVCRSCHAGKFDRRKSNLHLHPNVNRCGDCHQLHGANGPAMLKMEGEGNGDLVCVGCHEDHDNFSHPTGNDAYDPRNGQAMNCISCHDPCNGTFFKYNLRGTSDKGLCIKCHAGY